MVVLDTHAWLWWVDAPERLSDRARTAIDEAGAIGVAAISCWEVAMLVVKRRVELALPARAWVRQALSQPGIVALPLGPAQAVEAALLDPQFPGDPADRLIYATARDQGAALVTRDGRLREFDPRLTVW
jgi:PIN domain nuclease of toxin-antitoxin system